jgi:hypothetical protein
VIYLLLIAITVIVELQIILFAWLVRRKRKIVATAGPNGKIIPEGTVSVNRGGDRTFSIAANPGYRISDVQVDGNSIGAIPCYTFIIVKEDHTISATFKPE